MAKPAVDPQVQAQIDARRSFAYFFAGLGAIFASVATFTPIIGAGLNVKNLSCTPAIIMTIITWVTGGFLAAKDVEALKGLFPFLKGGD